MDLTNGMHCTRTHLSVCGKDVDVVDGRGRGEEAVARPLVVHAAAVALIVGRGSGGNCIKIGLPGKLILSKRKDLREVLFS